MAISGLATSCTTTAYISDRCLTDHYITFSQFEDSTETIRQIVGHNEDLDLVCGR